jgi:hypothetical protein
MRVEKSTFDADSSRKTRRPGCNARANSVVWRIKAALEVWMQAAQNSPDFIERRIGA